MQFSTFRTRVMTVSLLGILGLSLPSPAPAATITINTTDDELNSDSDCSLREAIRAANTNLMVDACAAGEATVADELIVPAGVYTLTLGPAGDDDALNGDLDIIDNPGTVEDLTITGAGAASVIIEACTVDQKTALCPAGQGIVDRVFEIRAGASATITDVTIQNGVAINGPGIFNSGVLSMTNSVVRNSAGIGVAGGAILSEAAMLTMRNSTVSDNPGGGIHVRFGGAAVLDGVAIMNNVGGFGAGIRLGSGMLTVTNSTLGGNTASGGGRGAGIMCDGGALTLTNSTVSGNTAINSFGGGLSIEGCTADLNNVTVSNNTAHNGGGIFHNSGMVNLRNTIIAGNFDSIVPTNPDCAGTLISQGFNLVGDGSGCSGVTDGVNGDQVGTTLSPIDPLLGVLANNGGLTQTHALLDDSPAIDTGNPAGCADSLGNPLTTDQRGVTRPQGTACDVGAYEKSPPTPLGPFMCYKIKSSRGNLCANGSPNEGASCDDEDDCGGTPDVTDFCVPNRFPRGIQATLTDQFEQTVQFDIKKPAALCNPAIAAGRENLDLATHLEGFQTKLTRTDPRQAKHQPRTDLHITNQFHPNGELVIDTIRPNRLLVPTAKSLTGPVDEPDPAAHNVDHYNCYTVKVSKGDPKFPKGLQAQVVDQFSQPKLYDLKKPTRLCAPADKNDEDPNAVMHADHLMCYQAKIAKTDPKQSKHQKVRNIFVNNQFGPEQLDTRKEDELCVPSTKA